MASYYKSEFYLAEDFFLKAIDKFDFNESSSLIEACYNNIGICREMSSRLDEAIESYLRSCNIAEERNDSVGLMQTNINIGLLNLKINKIEEGKQLLKETEVFFENRKDSVNLALIYQNFAKAADLEGDIKSFIDFSNRALNIYQVYDYQPGVCEILNNLGNAFIKIGNYSQAKEKLEEGLQIALDNGLKNSEGFILSNLGKLAYQQNNWNIAELFYQDSKLIFEDFGNIEALIDVSWDFF